MSGFDHKPHIGSPEHEKMKAHHEKLRQMGLKSLGNAKPIHDSSDARAKADAFYKARAEKRAKTLALKKSINK